MGRISIDGALAVVAAAFPPYTGDLDRTNRGTRVRLVVYDQRGKYVHETPETDDGVIRDTPRLRRWIEDAREEILHKGYPLDPWEFPLD